MFAETQLNPTRLLTPTEKSIELDTSTETLRRWRRAGIGPRYVQHANTIRYFPERSPGEAAE